MIMNLLFVKAQPFFSSPLHIGLRCLAYYFSVEKYLPQRETHLQRKNPLHKYRPAQKYEDQLRHNHNGRYFSTLQNEQCAQLVLVLYSVVHTLFTV